MTKDRSTSADGGPASGLRRVALPLFLVAIGARIVWILAGQHNFNFVDLRVYYEAAQRVTADGGLYDFALRDYTPQQPLPFTYPPFAALFFYPLKFLPFPVVAVGWVALTAGLLFLVIRMCLAILAAGRGAPSRLGDVPRELPLVWTAAALWIDPVRTNLDYGQINVVLMTFGVWAAYLIARTAPSPSLALRPEKVDGASGFLVGLAAGIKLTPAVGGLFLLARGRVWAAVFSGVTFAATVGISYLILPSETRRYFTVLLGDTGPIGDPAKPDNQALRGAISRFAGHDVGTGPAWIIAVLVAAVLLFAAWWVVRRGDALIALVLVQFLGLLASPISWIHHFVWIVPLLIWVVHGPLGPRGGEGFEGPGAAFTSWATRAALVIAVFGYIGVHFLRKGLEAIGIEDGVVWALLMAPGVLAVAVLVALILAQRRRLDALV
ncbi:hypothetical protein AXK56_05935 [Tsukamurella pulmonis]|uniref:Alpha-1,2-mannosyltransferase n=1 Tax=Tsukamurella pulmonis TaxID=47312 RepID=A0A1H1CY83_9ACTN|nr:glycosyltransferase 87 family protein [Tsukamurella pulmonis]KXO89707.1 hypothetical protein AXK56_05935 [Tsukamurella pulmonis]SDQ68969.1 alpha-1,2-mannosyltransferase [Tsukamurella pulmonis]SUP22862.1 Polyprenol-phosphate-mannose-dependent alpha-(1-2)-phosphatidylinositol pentamannoside mannosyltransferase [Tsukamurella pulmonis]